MNGDHAKREFELYRKDEFEARAILDAADTAQRATTPEEDERYDKLIASAETHKNRANQMIKLDTDGDDLAARVRARIGDVSSGNGAAGDAPNGTDQQLLANIRASKVDFNAHSNYGQDLTFEARVDLGKRNRMTPALLAYGGDETRAIADFSDNGALYTTDFATRVAVYQRTVSPWINLATILNADNGRPLNLPNLTVDPTAYTPGEGTAITEATPTIGSAALTTTAYKGLSYVSMEAEEDELVGLLGIIAKSQGRSIGLKFGSDLTATLITAMTNGGTAAGVGGNGTAVATFFGYEDLIDLKYSAAVPYRLAGSWVMSNTAIKKVRKFHDQQGQYFWQPAAQPGGLPMFDDNPVYEDPFLAAVASASKSVVFGDVNEVVIKQMALRLATSVDYRFNTDQVAIKTVYRAGGALPDATALRYLVSANT